MRNYQLFSNLLLTSILLFVSLNLNSSNLESQSVRKQVDLEGELSKPVFRSIVKPVEIYIVQGGLYIIINSRIGNSELTIYDNDNNIVYYEKIDGSSNTNQYADLFDFPEGFYKILIKDEMGRSCFGSFKMN